MKRYPRPRATVNLRESVHRQLNSYAVAAGAAGVSLIALMQSAEAKVVYTPAHVVISANQIFGLDLAHDGQVDFTLSNTTLHTTSGRGGFGLFLRKGEQGNCSLASSRRFSFAAALPKGVRLSAKHFTCGVLGDMVVWSTSGPWYNVRGRYLGLKFHIGKEIHYGWARLNVSQRNGVVATLTGYAYETIPNKAIVTGKTHGPDVATVQPASLGHLAAGASAIPAWRVKQTAATTHSL
jgi:hypothetical protein